MASTSHFAHAHDFKIDNVSIYNYSSATKQALDLLHENSALGALHNSSERCDAPKCHAETRVAVQQEIFSWIAHGDRDAEPKRVLWMSGPAGCGKTAIAGSVAETCKDEGLLAATFFFSSFSGSQSRRSRTHLVATIAYQFLQHGSMQEVGRRILSCVQRNPGIFQMRLKDQFEELVLQPLREYRREGGDMSGWPKVIIIDGLDEVEPDLVETLPPLARTAKESVHLEVLYMFMQAVLDPSFPFSIVIASRPERVIRDFFCNDAKHITRNIFLDQKYDPDSDILLFYQSKFAEIRRRYDLPANWPTEEAMRILVENASGQFVYAATVLRFVQDPIQLPQAQLECVLGLAPSGKTSNPFGPLDALYARILKGSPNPKLVILWLTAMTWDPPDAPGLFWRQFLESMPGEGEYLFANLSSLVDGKRFFYEYRILQVMKNKGPAVPCTEAEVVFFLQFFFKINLNNITRSVAPHHRPPWDIAEVSWASPAMPEDDLLACDVNWLICAAIEHTPLDKTRFDVAGDIGRYPQVVDIVVGAFWHVHSSCHWYRCRPVCVHWRTSILRVCEEMGWTVPGRMTLFRNRFTRYGPVMETTGGYRVRFPLPGVRDFVPPRFGYYVRRK